MKYLLCMMTLLSSDPTQVIFDFNKNSDIGSWYIVDDVVMGGRSSGSFKLNTEGNGTFEGDVSLENNGGFSSVHYKFDRMDIENYTSINLKLKGDGKQYQFRIKSNSADRYSYIIPFSTTGEMEEIEIPLKDMYPSFRGRKLDQPNFAHDHIEEIIFLIGNKRNESFKLLIDRIVLK